MTDCPSCGSSSWQVVDTNGAEYPETLVETRQCHCGREWVETLTA